MTTENLFIKGNYIIGGEYCEHCSEKGIDCRAEGVFFSNVSAGKIVVAVDGIDFEISGTLNTCKIANETVKPEDGLVAIKQMAKKTKLEIIAEATRVALEEMEEGGPTEAVSDIWTQSK